MMQIEVNTTTATLIPPRESLTTGSVNAVQLQFTFSDEWNGLTKTCVFSNELETVPAEIQNDATSVPEEILDEVYRWISVGVSGEDAEGTVIIPTIWCRIGQCLPGVSGRFVTIDMLQAYWSKQEIDLHTDGDGTKFLGDDGLYHIVQGGGSDEKTFVAEYGVTTAQEIIDFADATKEPFAPILVKRGADYYTVTTVSKQATNKVILVTLASLSGNYYTFTYTITDGTWASSSYGFQKLLESGVNIKTVGGQSILGSGDIPVQGLSQVQADWNEADTTSPAYIQNKPTIPDISGLATKDELTAAVEPLATKTELANATAGLATTAAMNAALALKADKSELNSYARQYDVNQALATKADKTELGNYATKSEIITVTDGDGTQFLANDGTYKRVQTDLSSYLTKTEAEQTYATQTEVADKADKSEIITVTTGTGTLFLADDGTYKLAAGDPPDLSAYLTKTEAGTTYETQTHAAETYATKAEIPDVSGFETTAHASATYATKTELTDGLATKADSADIADMLTKTEAGTTYVTQTALTEGLATKVDTATLADYETTAHASATYATKAEIPDVSGFETTTHAEATYATKTELADKADASAVDSALALKADKTELTSYETTEHASATYATKTELTEGLAGKVDTADISDMLTKTEAEGTYADKVSMLALENTVEAQRTRITNLETNKADKTEIITVTNGTGTLFLADDGTYKPAAGDPPDLSAYLTKTEAGTTYATQTALTEGLAGKVDTATLADYETTAHASATYATKAELPDVSDMLSKTEAGTTYATKTELADKADSTTVTALSGVVTGHTAEIAALQTGKADKSEIPDVSGFETTTHAEQTYLKKDDASEIKIIKSAKHTVTVENGMADIGGTTVSRNDSQTSTNSYSVITVKQNLPATADATGDEGASFVISKAGTLQGQWQVISIDGVRLTLESDFVPVRSKANVINTSGTGTLFLADDGTYKPAAGDPPDLSAYLTKTEAGTTYATKTELADKADASALADYETSAHASATYATKAEIPDVSGFETTAHASATYATKTELTDGLATKANSADIADMLTKTEAGTTYATQTALTEGLAGKVDTATLADYETTAHASATYATKAEIPDVTGFETTAHAEATYLKIADASPIKSITAGDIALTPDANGNVTVGRTSVTVSTTPTNPPAISCGIKEYAPSGASANSGASMFISVAEAVTGSTDTYKEARVQITDNQSNSSFANLVSKEWVQEYIASLDGTNMTF